MRCKLIYLAILIQALTILSIVFVSSLLHRVEDYLDLQFMKWLFWICAPVIVLFLLPLVVLLFVYGCIVFIHMYKWRHRIQEEVHKEPWDALRVMVASFWDATGCIWHGYEVEGMENVPQESPAVIVYYHAALPLDMIYLHAKLILSKRRSIRLVADKFLFTVPGWKFLLELFGIIPGTVESCSDLLQNQSALLSIAPGGVREAQFSSEYYELIWGSRAGFAKVALNLKVPIIPMFTQNCREAFRTPSLLRRWLRRYYERWRIPFVPIYGGFPVKMITYLGSPIYPSVDETVDDLRQRVMEAVENLIIDKQRIPGNILQSILDRFRRRNRVTDDPCTTLLEMATAPEPEQHEAKDEEIEGICPDGGSDSNATATTPLLEPNAGDRSEMIHQLNR